MADTLVSSKSSASLTAVLDLDLAYAGLENPDLKIAIATALRADLGPATTPISATKAWAGTVALITGAKTLDLTALPRGNAPDVDLTGLTIKAVLIYNRSGNAVLTIAKGATNGYFIFGATASTVALPDGFYNQFGVNNVAGAGALAAVDETHKTIDFTGTGTESFEIAILA